MNSLQNFKTYQLAKAFYQKVIPIKYGSANLRDQMLRAASSVALNLAEGSAKSSAKERARFYEISLASLREAQAVIDLQNIQKLSADADMLGAHIYRLISSTRKLNT